MTEPRGRFLRRWENWGLRTKGLAVVAVPLAALALAGGVFAGFQREDQQAAQLVNQSQAVRSAIQNVTIDLVNAETGVRGFLLTRQASFLQPFLEAQASTAKDIGHLSNLVKDDPAEAGRAQQVKSLAAIRLAHLQALLAATSVPASAELSLLAESKTSMDAVRAELSQMDHDEAGLQASRTAANSRITTWFNVAIGVVIGVGLIGGFVASLLFGISVSRRVRRLQENADRLQDEVPLTDLPSGDDEVGRLGAALGSASVLLSEKSQGLREAQEFLDHLITASPVVVLRAAQVDPATDDWGAVYVSANAERIFGYSSDEILADPDFLLLVHPDDRRRLDEAFLTAIQEGGTELEFRLRHKAGDYRWVRTTLHSEPAESGMTLAMLGYLRDVTERKGMEADLRAARRAAVEAARIKSQFLATMSHEIRTPLNGVIGMTGLMLDTVLNPEQREYAETARASGEALLTVINDILDFSKIEAGKMLIETLDFDLRTVVEEGADLLAEQAHAKALELATRIDPDVPLDVSGDPGRLRQILLNLVSNAVKFTETGGVVVAVHLAPTESGGPGTVRFDVTDTGIGLSAEDQRRLFQSFSQVDASTSRRFGGTGLGLAISRQLVELMGGRIGVESQPGQGSTFWFTLPLPAAATRLPLGGPDMTGTELMAVDDDDALPTDPSSAGARANHRRHLLLVVEDNPVSQKVAARNLEKLGYRVDVAANGTEALDAVERQSYAAVLMDCQMPEMDGYTATAEIRRGEGPGARLPIIALTAGAMSGDRERALAAGMDDYLSKPLKVEALAAALQRWAPIDIPPDPPDDGGPDLDPATIAGLRDLGGSELLDDLVSLFRDEVDRYLNQFDQALADHDPGALQRASHSFKGSSANLGATRLAAVAAAIEQLGVTGDLMGAQALDAELISLCNRALDALAQETGLSPSPLRT
ncbi:MAG TPA: ATP-binding protein [Acidimicrobiales bacterium]|nr:ATP-binding protein [Acidimicrobiales bacterium]